MTLIKWLLKTLYKNIAVILTVSFVCVIAAGGYSLLYATHSYTATSKVLIHNGSFAPSAIEEGDPSVEAYLNSCTELLNSTAFYQRYLTSFSGLEINIDELSSMVDIKPEGGNSLVFYVSATSKDPDTAVAVSADVANAIPPFIKTQSKALDCEVLEVAGQASIDRVGIFLLILISFTAGLVLSSVLVLILSLFNSRVKNENDYKIRYSLPILDSVPDFESKSDTNLPIYIVQSYKSIRDKILENNEETQVIALSSPEDADGKTTTAINLAVAFGKLGKKTLLIDTDLENGTVARRLSLFPAYGLSNLLQKECTLDLAITAKDTCLDIISRGTARENCQNLLSSETFEDLISGLRLAYDYIVIDSPTITENEGILYTLNRADGVVLVIREGKTAYSQIDAAMELLKRSGGMPLGTVINASKE